MGGERHGQALNKCSDSFFVQVLSDAKSILLFARLNSDRTSKGNTIKDTLKYCEMSTDIGLTRRFLPLTSFKKVNPIA